jgi:PAS domain-containing protein
MGKSFGSWANYNGRNSENQVVGYVGTITDITDRKLAEQELK